MGPRAVAGAAHKGSLWVRLGEEAPRLSGGGAGEVGRR